MEDVSLNYLLPRKEEINGVSPWASVQLRYIRDDLKPLIERGVPINHLVSLIAPLEITSRKNTIRNFIRSEYPEYYARYYAKAGTAEQIRNEQHRRMAVPETHKKEEAPKPTKKEKSHAGEKSDINRMLGMVSDFAAGAHFKNDDENGEDL